MYVRTPKRYRRNTIRRSSFPLRFLFLALFVGVLVGLGLSLYANRHIIEPAIEEQMRPVVENINNNMATITAPTPSPTPDPTNNLEQANTYWANGAVSQAVRLYQQIWDALPNDEALHYRVTLGHIVQGNYDDALVAAERTITASPFSSDAWAIRAWALDWAGRPEEAVASALMARELDPNNPRAYAYLAEAYFTLNNVQRANATIARALEIDANTPEIYRASGLITAYSDFDFFGALNELRTGYDLAVDSNPPLANFIAVTDMVQLQIALGNDQQAIDLLNDVLERNPESTPALAILAFIYRARLIDAEQGLDFAQRCVEIDPDSIDCFYELGRSQRALGQSEQAAIALEQAVLNGSTLARHYWWAGQGQLDLGRCAQAQQYATRGYEMAQREGNEDLIADFEFLLDQTNTCF